MGRHCKLNSNNQSILLAPEVKMIGESLLRAHGIDEINAFSYSRVFLDGSRLELWSDAEALYHTFINKKYIASTYTPDSYGEEDRFVYLANKMDCYPQWLKVQYARQLEDQREFFDHDHCFLIVNKNETYCEYAIFYLSSAVRSAINFYINHLEALEKFSFAFKDYAKKLIQTADMDRIVKPWRDKDALSNHTNFEYVNKDLDSSKKIKIHLTRREKQVMQHIVSGKTAKEIGVSLGLSNRTVESYLGNIKDKFSCNRKSDLIVKFIAHKKPDNDDGFE